MRTLLIAAVCASVIATTGLLAACQRRARARAEARRAAAHLTCHLRHPRFHTLPSLHPTGFCVARRKGAAPDDILVTPRPDPKKNPGQQFGLMIVSPQGKLLWYARRPDKVHDLKVATYQGMPVLAFFQKRNGGRGYYQLLDQHYRRVARIRAGHGYSTNLHELALTPAGTAYVTADVNVHNATEYVVEEVDVATGRVLFDWHSLGHVGVRDSYEERPRRGAWDYFHGNSVDPPEPGGHTVLISSRNTSSVYGVDRRSGRTEWILGGKRDQFGIARRHPSWVFCGQHDVHRLANGDIEMFDNGGTFMHGQPRCPVHPARVLIFRVDPKRHRVRLVSSISSRPLSTGGKGWFSGWVGSARRESNGDTLIDWGGPINRVTGVTPGGREDLFMRLEFWSYRAVPAQWTGLPDGAPAIKASRDGKSVRVYASWNGATRISRWQVLAGNSSTALSPAGAGVPFADLETRIAVNTRAQCVAVEALDSSGAVLGRSGAVRVAAG